MSVSLKDIANALGLSKATVSWILSDQGDARGFNEDTINKVKRYAAEVNYRPNKLAKSLALGCTHTLGLILPSIGDTFFAQLVLAIESEAEKHNYILTICSSRGDPEKEKLLIRTLCENQVDGLIIVPSGIDSDAINALLKDNFPFVLVDRNFPELKANSIVADNFNRSYRLTESLVANGCRNIAFITADVNLNVMQLRYAGYLKALEDNDIPVDTSLYVETEKYVYDDIFEKKMEELFFKSSKVDAIVFATHHLAHSVLKYLVNNNIPFQDSLRIASIHSNTALELMVANLSVARIPIDKLGSMAVDMLLDNIRDPHKEKEEVVLDSLYRFG